MDCTFDVEGRVQDLHTGKNQHSQRYWNKPKSASLDGENFIIGLVMAVVARSEFDLADTGQEHTIICNHGYTRKTMHLGLKTATATDLLAENSYELIDKGAKSSIPFFIMISPVALDSNLAGGGKKGDSEDAGYDDNGFARRRQCTIPAERHKNLFPKVRVPRSDNFNPERPSEASWIRNTPRHSAEYVEYNDLYYRCRLQALQAVDGHHQRYHTAPQAEWCPGQYLPNLLH